MNQTDAANSQHNDQQLTRLYTKWVLGKNRGIHQPLNRDELIALLQSGLVKENQLNQEEKIIINRHNLNIDEPQLNTSHNVNHEIGAKDYENIRIAHKIVQGLLQRIDQYYANFYSEEDWNSMSKLEKEIARKRMFITLYGKNTEDFGYQLYQSFSKTI